jgi:hypothetical protein
MGMNAQIVDEQTKREEHDNWNHWNYFCDTISYGWLWAKVNIGYDTGQAKVCITYSLHELA